MTKKFNKNNYVKKSKKVNLVFNRSILAYKLDSKRIFSSLKKRNVLRGKPLSKLSKNLLYKSFKARSRKNNFEFKPVNFIKLKFILKSFSIFNLASHLTSFSRTWNSDYFNFILGKRFKRAIIDPALQTFNFQRIYGFIKLLMMKNMQCLIYEPRLISRMKAEDLGISLGEWVPGMLTNKEVWSRLLAKNRIRFFFPLYVILFLSDAHMVNFVNEMRRLGIPTIGFLQPYIASWAVDYSFLTNLNHRLINYYLMYLKFQFMQTRKALLFKLAYFRKLVF